MNDNRISHQLQEYLAYKRSLGFELDRDECVLQNFVRYTIKINYDGPLKQDIASEWATVTSVLERTVARKLELLCPFSKYVKAFDSQAEIVTSYRYARRDRPTPYIFSEQEVLRLMEEAQSLFSPDGIRGYTVETVIGLLWSTGLRPGEPVRLTIGDVDLENQRLYIRKTKFNKDRFVPISDSVSNKLRDYKERVYSEYGCAGENAPFFYTTRGKPLTERALAYAFSLIRPCINAHPSGYPAVRLYDFRHTFACNTIRRWNENGIDANSKLHILSTYMGHEKPQDTYWYLSATPELLAIACSKYETTFGGDSDDI